MERSNSLGVRKGAWSKEEDVLLKNCVEQHGEGKWHLVPPRTGLNRCRKSCRLRWFNYLRPNITRGSFSKDEVDLLIRMHKLLGNRWSLIAGRLPGRTANDIKNFWNCRMEKKPRGGGKGQPIQKTITKTNIIRPRPLTFSSLTIHEGPGTALVTYDDHEPNDPNKNNNNDDKLELSSSKETDECIQWWSKIIDAAEEDVELENDIPLLHDTWKGPGLSTGEINPGGLMDDGDYSFPVSHDFEFDDDVWELLGFGHDQNNI